MATGWRSRAASVHNLRPKMLLRLLFAISLLGAVSANGVDEPKFEFERTVAKNQVAIDRPIICESSTAATIGFYVPFEMLEKGLAQEIATIGTQTKPNIWKLKSMATRRRLPLPAGF